MTCKDCIHYDVCKDDYNCGYLFKDENGNYFTDDCQHFKRKADFVEVVRCKDCKYGDVSCHSLSKDGKKQNANICSLIKKRTSFRDKSRKDVMLLFAMCSSAVRKTKLQKN